MSLLTRYSEDVKPLNRPEPLRYTVQKVTRSYGSRECPPDEDYENLTDHRTLREAKSAARAYAKENSYLEPAYVDPDTGDCEQSFRVYPDVAVWDNKTEKIVWEE